MQSVYEYYTFMLYTDDEFASYLFYNSVGASHADEHRSPLQLISILVCRTDNTHIFISVSITVRQGCRTLRVVIQLDFMHKLKHRFTIVLTGGTENPSYKLRFI